MFIFNTVCASPFRKLHRAMVEDLQAVTTKDPATSSALAAFVHPGVHAVWLHRIAHAMHEKGMRTPARFSSYFTRVLTGVDIHPGAAISPGVFIDHGAAVVIGETATLERDVMIYHNVTIGSVGWWNPKIIDGRRHPYIKARTIICTGAMLFGPLVVGSDCVIGACAVILADVPDGTKISPGEVWRGPAKTPHRGQSNPMATFEYTI